MQFDQRSFNFMGTRTLYHRLQYAYNRYSTYFITKVQCKGIFLISFAKNDTKFGDNVICYQAQTSHVFNFMPLYTILRLLNLILAFIQSMNRDLRKNYKGSSRQQLSASTLEAQYSAWLSEKIFMRKTGMSQVKLKTKIPPTVFGCFMQIFFNKTIMTT